MKISPLIRMRLVPVLTVVLIAVAIVFFPRHHPDVPIGIDEGVCPARNEILENFLPQFCLRHRDILGRYKILDVLGDGFFGEARLAKQLGDPHSKFVIKRIKEQAQGHGSFYLSGLRERYFGQMIAGGQIKRGKDNIVHFIESFQDGKDLFLVTQFSGVSLHSLMYDEPNKNMSNWWVWLRSTPEGERMMAHFIHQLIKGLSFLHNLNITHRDIKPENVLISSRRKDNEGTCSNNFPNNSNHLDVHIIDFGSALDDYSRLELYGSEGPSSMEQTDLYLSPEDLLRSNWLQGPVGFTAKYDMWSVGLLYLELIFGEKGVFKVTSPKFLAEIEDNIDNFWAHRFLAFKEMCIGAKDDQSKLHCSDFAFSEYVKGRDPLHLGFPNMMALKLVRQLLSYYPEDRPTAEAALDHAYFRHYDLN